MSTKQEIAGLGHSNTLKKFRYTLLTKDDNPLTLYRVPDGWKSGELTFMRDKTYKGVIESFSTNSFDFIKEARDFIQTAYERGGIDYEITIYIDILVNSTFQYQRYFTGKLDLSTYKIDSIKASCEIIPTGFQNTVLNRDDINVDLFNTKFIGGGEGSMAQISGIPSTFIIPEYTAKQNTDWELSGDAEYPIASPHYIPMIIKSSEYDGSANQSIGSSTKFFTADDTYDFRIHGNIEATLVSQYDTIFTYQAYLVKNGITIKTWYQESSVAGKYMEVDFTVDENVSVVSGDELSLTVTMLSSPNDIYTLEYGGVITMEAALDSSLTAITVNSFPIFEFMTRILQLISGKAIPMDSDFLGRTDSSPVTYASDGDGSLMFMTNGKLIRQFPPTLQTVNASLKDTFQTLNSIFNIGLSFEDNKVKIEDESYFFDITDNPDYPATDTELYLVNQILDLSGDVTNKIISKEVLPDWYFNEIGGGYGKFEYENIQGLKEFNTKTNYATPIKSVKSKLNIESKYRYDTQGVNKLREKQYLSTATEDVTGDEDIFGFDVKRDTFFTAKTDEDFDVVYGGVDPTQSYNLNFTPRRNLERHGPRLRSMQLAAGDEIQWMSSDKNTKLVTQKTGESEKPENGDIIVGNLNKGYWIPEAYICEAPVDETIIAAIQANPRGVIKIGTDKYGWILEVQTNNEDKKGQFKLLRVDLNNVKII